jgi:3-oxoacyl-[acyl-carrier protein] reductase
MVQAGRRGAIINLSSQAVRGAGARRSLLGEQERRGRHDARHGARAGAARDPRERRRPRLTDTAQPRYGHDEEGLAALARAVPIGRMAQPSEIGDVIVFLASDDAALHHRAGRERQRRQLHALTRPSRSILSHT